MAEWSRSVQHRCKNIGRHSISGHPGCACHPNIPMPCPDCYSIEVFSRRIPYQPNENWHDWIGTVTPISHEPIVIEETPELRAMLDDRPSS